MLKPILLTSAIWLLIVMALQYKWYNAALAHEKYAFVSGVLEGVSHTQELIGMAQDGKPNITESWDKFVFGRAYSNYPNYKP